jgi:V8-like Glu-specific endopeptidase
MPYSPNVLPATKTALFQVFTVAELTDVASSSLGFDLRPYLPAAYGTAIEYFGAAVDALNRHDQLGPLINAAREARPRSSELVRIAELLGLVSAGRVIGLAERTAQVGENLERAIRPVEQHVDLPALRERLSLAEQRVGLVEVVLGGEAKGFGTGFLIGPAKVLTNWHVAEPLSSGTLSPAAVRLRFDLKRDINNRSFSGRTVPLAADWLGLHQPYANFDVSRAPQPDPTAEELDFAVLNLADPIGDRPVIANSGIAAEDRGWFDLDDHAAPPPAGEPLFVIGHPVDHPLTASIGKVLEHAGQGRRMRHDAWTLNGSSGSPVLDGNGRLVGLHHGSEPVAFGVRAVYNQAIPMSLVAAALAAGRS